MDLVLVGTGTVRTDRPRLDARRVPADAALPATEPAAGFVSTHLAAGAAPARDRGFVFHAAGAVGTPPRGFVPVPCPTVDGRVDPRGLLTAAAARGLHAVMLEGGPRLAASFLAADCVDTWVHYVAPTVVGSGVTWPDIFPAPAGRWHLRGVAAVGTDVRVIWDRRNFAATLTALTTDRARDVRVTELVGDPEPPGTGAGEA
jgi:diaminohydroxyphosphoribosylaminopyrimidine deaminase/5-amino-6-(5-phosphoribosylamino)uracil reductase